MNIIEAMRKAREQGVGITNPDLKISGIFLYSLYDNTVVEVRRTSDGFEEPDGMLIPDWRPTPEELCADDWELYSEGKEIEPVNCGESVLQPQMPEEKKKLVDMLLKYMEDKIARMNESGYDYDDPTIRTLPDIAMVISGLVN